MLFPTTLLAASVLLAAPRSPRTEPSGGLIIAGDEAAPCPLKHTAVHAEVSGFLARVTVTQQFINPLDHAIEAVYLFPLPHRAAVDEMTMKVGDRTIQGTIRRREEARRIYEDARKHGRLASLLNQDRPNVFTQAVANIGPGMKVEVTIRYIETLGYEGGGYEFAFPMVVGPRYNPRGLANPVPGTFAAKGSRAGHDISLSMNIDAGLPIRSIASPTHAVDLTAPTAQQATVRLRQQHEIPNRDFLLRWAVAGNRIEDALLAHREQRGGFFTFILQPPQSVRAAEVTPKEIVFVVDTSGSMSGFPIEKSKEVIKLALDGLNPRDTFNLITFAGDTHILFPKPVPATEANVHRAQQFLLGRSGGGGTEMMKAIRTALAPGEADHIRIVCFLTDGYVGNDMEIVDEVKRYSNARVFSFGVGSSVNRFLLDKMAEAGRGDVEYVGLDDDGSAAAQRFWARIRNPLLTDISIDWNGLPVTEIYPARHRDLFDAKPVTITGRYSTPASGTIRLRGRRQGHEFVGEIAITLPGAEPRHAALAALWARSKVEHLQSAKPSAADQEEITRLGLDYRLMTQYTSFVAVEEKVTNRNGIPQRIEIPLEMPHGVSHDGVFGARAERASLFAAMPGKAVTAAPAPTVSTAAPSNLDPALTAMVLRFRQGQVPGATFVNVKLWLKVSDTAMLAALRKLGVQITAAKPGNILLGRVFLDKLEALARLAGVQFVSLDPGRP